VAERAEAKTWEGWWWFPGEPIPDPPAHGTLSFDGDSDASLHLVVASALEMSGTPPTRRDAIHGTTAYGRPVSLLNAVYDGARGTLGAGHTEDWRGELVIDGEHVASYDSFEVDDLAVRILGLREWLAGLWTGPPAFVPYPDLIRPRRKRGAVADPGDLLWERQRVRRNAGRIRSFQRLTRPTMKTGFDARLPNGLRLTAGFNTRESHSRFSSRTDKEAWLRALTHEPLPLPELLDRAVEPFVDFLVFALGDQARVEGITVARRDPVEPFMRPAVPRETSSLSREVTVYRKPWPLLRRDPPNYRPQLMLPRQALAGQAESVLRRWWEILKRLEPAHTTLFGVWGGGSVYLENALLNLASFAEGYHERFNDEPLLDPRTHRKMVDRVVRPLPREVRAIYRRALSRAHLQTQKERLTDLVAWATAWIPEITDDEEAFVDRLVATRNHLAHAGQLNDKVITSTQELVDAVERLSAVLRVNLLLELDIESDALEWAFYSRYGDWDLFR
jgi:hypothetical protein